MVQRCVLQLLKQRRGVQVGGLAGSLLAGRLADWLVNRSPDKIRDGAVGKRVQVHILSV